MLKTLPESLSNLHDIEFLDLSFNMLKTEALDIIQSAPKLWGLDVSLTSIKAPDNGFPMLPKKVIYLAKNQLKTRWAAAFPNVELRQKCVDNHLARLMLRRSRSASKGYPQCKSVRLMEIWLRTLVRACDSNTGVFHHCVDGKGIGSNIFSGSHFRSTNPDPTQRPSPSKASYCIGMSLRTMDRGPSITGPNGDPTPPFQSLYIPLLNQKYLYHFVVPQLSWSLLRSGSVGGHSSSCPRQKLNCNPVSVSSTSI